MIPVLILPGHGAEATRRCIEHVRAARCEARCEVSALGEGTGQRFDRDVVLLDALVRVPDGWLDRLMRCALREPGMATVSPFCNDAGLCSYPRMGTANPLPPGMTLAQLDTLFARENAGLALDIPAPETACLFVARQAFEAAGQLDEGFFLRARHAGLRHLACADLFVYRGPTAPAAQAAVRPEAAVREWVERDPLRPCRRRVDLARLQDSPRPRILAVTHNWGGGVARHVEDLARLLAPDREVLRLRPDGASTVELRWLRDGEEFQAWIEAADWEEGVELLRATGIDRLHFHHVHGLPREVLDLPRRLGVPYDVTLHDYYPVCPRYHLSPGDGEGCDGATDCDRCLSGQQAQWGLALAQWRSLFHAFLGAADRTIVPSHDMAVRLGRYLPDVPLLEWPHPELASAPPAIFKIAFLGSASVIKGARLLERCAADASARGLPLHFHVIGSSDRPMAGLPEVPLTIGGSYAEGDLPRLLALERPDAFVFLSQVEETYSYTLSAAMGTRLPIVATEVGAFPERLRGYPAHRLLPREASAAAVNDALLVLLRSPALRATAPAAAH